MRYAIYVITKNAQFPNSICYRAIEFIQVRWLDI